MRILIDATPLLVRSAGVKNYIYYWLGALRRHSGRDRIATFPHPGRFGPLDHEQSMAGRLSTRLCLSLVHGLNGSRVPWAVPGLDIFHCSQHLYNPPRRARLTTTVHDLTCWRMPQYHSPANVEATRWFGEHIVRRADGVIVDSESTRRDALDILGLDPARVVVIHPGVPEAYFAVTAEAVRSARERLGLSRPYALFVGTIEPRKNVRALLDAWCGVRAELRQQYELVVAGPAGWEDPATMARLQAPGAGVRYLGYVRDADLPGLTAGALLVAYPSLYEGFGFPVAEAMAAGVAVLTSNVSSLPEVAGEAALLVDPRSEGEIRAGLERLLGSPGLRERLGAAGRRRAEGWRWEVAARKSLEWFRGVAGASVD